MKLTGSLEVTSAYKMYVSVFCPGGLRSGQFRDLPILCLWENMKMLGLMNDFCSRCALERPVMDRLQSRNDEYSIFWV